VVKFHFVGHTRADERLWDHAAMSSGFHNDICVTTVVWHKWYFTGKFSKTFLSPYKILYSLKQQFPIFCSVQNITVRTDIISFPESDIYVIQQHCDLSGRSAKIERVQRAVFCMSCYYSNYISWHVVQKTASLNFCTPDNLFVKSSITSEQI